MFKISCGEKEILLTRITSYKKSFVSVRNTYTSSDGKSIIYPVRNIKRRISITAELQGDYINDNQISGEVSLFADIIHSPEFYCTYTDFAGGMQSYITEGTFTLASETTYEKILSPNGTLGGLYAVSFTIEEV